MRERDRARDLSELGDPPISGGLPHDLGLVHARLGTEYEAITDGLDVGRLQLPARSLIERCPSWKHPGPIIRQACGTDSDEFTDGLLLACTASVAVDEDAEWRRDLHHAATVLRDLVEPEGPLPESQDGAS